MNQADIVDEDLTALRRAAAEVSTVIVGQHRTMERLWSCLLAGGHALLEGVPGVGKTVLLSSIATAVGGTFSRIQFTADLMPSDIVGTRIYRASSETFTVEPGPIVANFVLADEVNRAPAKVQSALLEVMAEGQVTVGGQTLVMPTPFLVLATQNPIDNEGTYTLPEAQRDRFMMRIMVDYPTASEEWEVLNRHSGTAPKARAVMTADALTRLQARARAVPVDEAVGRYALDLVLATRDPERYGLGDLAGVLAYGASPRASLALLRSARALALLRGNDAVTSQEIYDVAYDVLNHRLVLSYKALADNTSVDDILRLILSTVRAPVHPSGLPGPGAHTPTPAPRQPTAAGGLPGPGQNAPTYAPPPAPPHPGGV
jgi:MoxR-like ATPase